MKTDRKERLERYFLNANMFFWGISKHEERPNKQEAYDWLEPVALNMWPGFRLSRRAAYHDVQLQLLRTPGIEKVMTDLVVPTVNRSPLGAVLDDVRRYWMSGRRPSSEFLKEHGLNPGDGCSGSTR